MKIAIDFDGTIVEHKYPDIGSIADGAFSWLYKWKEAGAQLILWTMRCDNDSQGPMLSNAVAFCKQHGIEFDGVNEGINDRSWTTSPKAHAHVYVDDAAFGCPTVPTTTGRPVADWSIIGPEVLGMIMASELAKQ